MAPPNDLIKPDEGLISNEVFSAATHERELQRIFARCWLFVGHETLIPENHDYFVSLMGIDSVIVQRDGAGRIRIYLNKCRHRGNEVCIYDEGNARAFTCAYHGWTYVDGKLTGVPNLRDAYLGELELGKWGLVEVPRVAILGGLIFASWNEEVVSLDDYLGDAKWYLENFLLREEMGGLEIIPGAQRYMMPVNWKLLAENFAGDDYHFASTHASVVQVLDRSRDRRTKYGPDLDDKAPAVGYEFSVAANYRRGVPHGFLDLKVGPAFFDYDRRSAEALGRDAVEWVEERTRRLAEKLQSFQVKPYAFHTGNIFPNFALIGVGTAMYGKGLILHHPAGPDRTEVWMWCAVEKNAPKAIKAAQKFVLMQRQAAAGMVAPDDHEIFQRISRNLRSPVARRHDFHYGMAVGHDEDDPRPAEFRSGRAWPGRILPRLSEAIQRDFYRYWADVMAVPAT
jgi:phenylpropionate dioxygenase-like ring-hydroxylating dioxygenase large terminal subunit